jgi:hypothetical protein
MIFISHSTRKRLHMRGRTFAAAAGGKKGANLIGTKGRERSANEWVKNSEIEFARSSSNMWTGNKSANVIHGLFLNRNNLGRKIRGQEKTTGMLRITDTVKSPRNGQPDRENREARLNKKQEIHHEAEQTMTTPKNKKEKRINGTKRVREVAAALTEMSPPMAVSSCLAFRGMVKLLSLVRAFSILPSSACVGRGCVNGETDCGLWWCRRMGDRERKKEQDVGSEARHAAPGGEPE